MDFAEAVLLGLVQGLTEFLPVSSSGHLVMVEALLGAEGEGILFEIAVHAGTLIAVLIFYRRRFRELASGTLRGQGDALRYVGKLAVATLPGVLVAFTVRDFFEFLFEEPWVVGLALVATGLALWTTRSTVQRAQADEPTWLQALVIGCVQVLAIVPGISRSGATVAAALAMGVAPLAAAEFSFLMSVPAIGGAVLLSSREALAVSSAEQGGLLLGAAVAALSGVVALWLFVRVLRNQHFHRFAAYTIPVGLAFLAWVLLRSA